MFFALFLLLQIELKPRICNHGNYVAEEERKRQPQKLVRATATNSDGVCNNTETPFRINFTIETNEVSSNITLTNIIRSTIQNVKNRVENFLYTTCPLEGNESGTNSPYLTIKVEIKSSDESTLASAQLTKSSTTYGYPTEGKMTIYSRSLYGFPEAQDYYSGDNSFFSTILHELNHILSFSQTSISNWRNDTTYTSSGSKSPVDSSNGMNTTTAISSLPDCNDTSSGGLKPRYCKYVNGYGFTQVFVRSDALNKYVNERFNVASENLKNLGLELEMFGGSGTAFAHPSSRIYFSDLMQGKTYGPQYTNDLLKAMLESTGWYKVKDSFNTINTILPFLQLDYYSLYEKTREDMLVNPGWYSFPKDIICTRHNQQRCFYDYRYKGVCHRNTSEGAYGKLDKSDTFGKQLFKTSESWLNPLKEDTIGDDSMIGNVPIFLPYATCASTVGIQNIKNGNPVYNPNTMGEIYSNSSICAESTLTSVSLFNVLFTEVPTCYSAKCGYDEKVYISVFNKELKCEYDGQRKTVLGKLGFLTCPPSNLVCKQIGLTKKTLPVVQMIPDRGPVQGDYLVLLKGKGFKTYPEYSGFNTSHYDIKLGEIDLKIEKETWITENGILARVPPLNETMIKQYKGKTVALTAKFTGFPELTTNYKNFFTFLE